MFSRPGTKLHNILVGIYFTQFRTCNVDNPSMHGDKYNSIVRLVILMLMK